MASHTVTAATTRLRVVRTWLVLRDPYLARNRTWTLYRGTVPGRRGGTVTRGRTGTGL